MRIIDIKSATKEVCKLLKEVPIHVRPINFGRYNLVRLKNELILITFKRDHFLTYNRHEKGAGYGETINKAELDYCNRIGIKRVFTAYKDRIYTIKTQDILNNSILRTTEAEDKEVYSFDMKLLQRFDKDLKWSK